MRAPTFYIGEEGDYYMTTYKTRKHKELSVISSSPSRSRHDSLHKEILLFSEQRPLPVFQTANLVPDPLHSSSYGLRIESRRMLPEQTQHLLPLELLVFHGLYFLLNSNKSSSDIHG